MSAWVRALRRARTPLSYSQGFHAHPKIAFSGATPVGDETVADYMDITLKASVEPVELLGRLKATLPEGFLAFEAESIALDTPSLMSAVRGASYTLSIPCADPAALEACIAELNASDEVVVMRKAKSGARHKGRGKRGHQRRLAKEVDIRPVIEQLELVRVVDDRAEIAFSTADPEGRLAKPKEILGQLGADPMQSHVLRTETLFSDHLTAV
jgi:radical SAM-linked protein